MAEGARTHARAGVCSWPTTKSEGAIAACTCSVAGARLVGFGSSVRGSCHDYGDREQRQGGCRGR